MALQAGELYASFAVDTSGIEKALDRIEQRAEQMGEDLLGPRMAALGEAAAAALEKVGDISEPVVSSMGVHILHYLRDIPGGAAELTDEMKAEIREVLEGDNADTAFNEGIEKWIAEAAVEWTEAGEPWKIPEEETVSEESAE